MKITEIIETSILIKQKILNDTGLINTIEKVSDEMVYCLLKGGKILFCGNGGSAADAQHLAAELSGRFYFDRMPFDAEALHVNTSYMTSVANDYSFDEVYARLVNAKGKKGDILFAISTSGNSKNIINAVNVANKLDMITVGMTGQTGGNLKAACKHIFNIPSEDTPRIQECHILIGHILCELVEKKLMA